MCFVFVFLHIHDPRPQPRFVGLSFRISQSLRVLVSTTNIRRATIPLDRCLLSNYHKQIWPRCLRVRLAFRPKDASTFQSPTSNWSAKVAGDATLWEALLLCGPLSYYNIIFKSQVPPAGSSTSSSPPLRPENLHISPEHHSCLFARQAHRAGTRRRCVLMACVITRSWIQIWSAENNCQTVEGLILSERYIRD